MWLGVNTPRGDCVGLLASLVGLYIIFSVSRGRARTTCTLDHLPMLFRPSGALISAGIRPQGAPTYCHLLGITALRKRFLLSLGAGGAEEVCKVGVAFLGGDVEGGFSLGIGGINIYAGYGEQVAHAVCVAAHGGG